MLKEFKIADNLNFVLEFGHKYIRFYTNHGILLNSDSSIYEIESPYKRSDLERLNTVQNGDILYMFHPNYPIKTLSRYGNTDWRINDLSLKSGPWGNVNTTDNAMKVNASTGEITITADSAVFASTDVGRLIRLTVINSDKNSWQVEKDVSKYQIIYSDGKYYRAETAGKTGSVKPVHSEGTVSDGSILFKYMHSGYGEARITQYISATKVKAYVTEQMPDDLVGGATTYWELGLIHSGGEYPMCGTFFRNRFCFMINDNGVPKVCLSKSDDYDNFADKDNGEVLASNAITVPVTSTQYNDGRWLCASDVLFIGTSSGEFYIDSASSANALAPDNVKIQQISEIGSLSIAPIKIGSHILFVTSKGTSVRDILYSYTSDAYDPIEISIYGKHLLTSGIVDMTYQESPDKIVWFAVNDGRLIGMTFSAEHEVNALHQHSLSGNIKNLAVIPNPENNLDDLWVQVRRTLKSGDVECIEWLDNGIVVEYPNDINALDNYDEKERKEKQYMKENSFYVDSGLQIIRKSAVRKAVLNLVGTDGSTITDAEVKYDVADYKTVLTVGDEVDISVDRITTSKLTIHFKNVRRGIYNVIFPESMIGCKVQRQERNSAGRYLLNVWDTITANNRNYRFQCIAENTTIEPELNYTTDVYLFISEFHIEKEKIELSGLEHLEGKEVAIMTDGAEQEHQVVIDGKVSIWNTAYNIVVGLPLKSAFIPQTIYIQGENSSGIGDVQRIDHITFMFWRSMGVMVGENFDRLEPLYFRNTDDAMNESSSLYTGNKTINVNFSTSRIKDKGASLLVYNDSVYPMNILAIAPHFSTSGNGL